jgi:hypothetical protein
VTLPLDAIRQCICKRTILGAIIIKRIHELPDGSTKEVIYAPNSKTIIWVRSENAKATIVIGKEAFAKFASDYFEKLEHRKRQLRLICTEPGENCKIFQGVFRLISNGKAMHSAVVSSAGVEFFKNHDYIILYDDEKYTWNTYSNIRLVSTLQQIYPTAGRPVAPQTINFPWGVDPHSWVKAGTAESGPKCILVRPPPR